MNIKKLKIGYVPYSLDLTHPGDRRRFPYFAKKNNIPFEIADSNSRYDIVLLNVQNNLSKWLIYKSKHPGTKFIFEMTDSVIYSSDLFRTLFKGIGRFLLRRESQLFINYKSPVKRWLKIADVVLCSSNNVKRSIQHFNSNIVVSIDYLQSEYKFSKNDYQIEGKMKLVWEGLGDVLLHLLKFKEVFRQVNSFCELHIITSEKYAAYGNVLKKNVSGILAQLPIKTVFHKWEMNTKDIILSECDLGIIPLNNKNLFAWHKPANKLISFWFTGLPTVVSDTPAYTELMNSAVTNLYCSDTNDWVNKIHLVKNMKSQERENLAKSNLNFVKDNYSDQSLDSVWMQTIEKLLK
ncbi:MAG: hypothetical protein M3Z26_04330 [Bacteroidota bacterium]|nr:hypothetical protein [Bacteroidota bacterium]